VRVLLRRAATLIARLREQAREGMPPGKGAAEAFRHAAPTIAVAGLILAGTFVSLTLAGNTILAQLGTSHITQRDDGIGMRTRRAAAPCAPETETKQECSTATFQGPVPLDDPGLARPPAPDRPGSSASGRHLGHPGSIL
jgi:hypothetical protein